MSDKTEALAQDMAKQLRARGKSLKDVASNAGRKLPKHLRAETDVILQAQEMADHPKLARLVDERRVAKAERKLRKYLDKQDPVSERRGEILDRIAAVSFVIFVLVVVAFFVLLSRGYFN